MSNDRDNLDYYPTPPWVTELLLEFLDEKAPSALGRGDVLEPCSGYGYISEVLREHGWDVTTNDINPETDTDYHRDFIRTPESLFDSEWVITNPPYETPDYHASDFVRRGLEVATTGMAMLLRLSFLEPCQDRFDLLDETPPSLQLITPRPRYVDGSTDSVTSVWVVWITDGNGGWLPMQEGGQEFAAPEARPALEDRRLPSHVREEDTDDETPGFLSGVV